MILYLKGKSKCKNILVVYFDKCEISNPINKAPETVDFENKDGNGFLNEIGKAEINLVVKLLFY